MSDLPARKIPVGLGELKVTHACGASLVAFGLGSCVAVLAYDRQLKIGGMAHVLLPQPGRVPRSILGEGTGAASALFAGCAVDRLLEHMDALGAERDRLELKISGGATTMEGMGALTNQKIGPRNVHRVKEAIASHGLTLLAEDTGGRVVRTIELDVDTGQVLVRTGDNCLVL